jgi:regulator of protease activity HflC (stomatin/prohibitin superfamily)
MSLTAKLVTGVGLIVILLIGWGICTTTINAGEKAVVLRLGKVDRTLDPGFHFITPFIEDVKTLEVRTVKIEVAADAASKDLQTVTTTIALNYNLKPDQVGMLWEKIGKDYKARIIDPAIQESVKSATAMFTAEELITKRPEVKDQIKLGLSTRLGENFINVGDVSIVNFQFSASFDTAIEAKVTAEQQALEAQNKLEQVKFEAEQKIATARAEAESVRLQAQALSQNTNYIELKRLDYLMEVAKRWDGALPQQFVPGSTIPLLNLGQ